MAIQRLSGGLTPADGADPRTFPTIWNDFADQGEVLFSQARVQNQRWNNLTINDFNDIQNSGPQSSEIFRFDGFEWVNATSPQYNTAVFFGESFPPNYYWYIPEDLVTPYLRITVTGAAGGAGTGSISATSGGDGGSSTVRWHMAGGIDNATAFGGRGGPWGGSGLPGQQARVIDGRSPINQSNARPYSESNSASVRSRGNNGAPGLSKLIYLNVENVAFLSFDAGSAGTTPGSSRLGRDGSLLIEYNVR